MANTTLPDSAPPQRISLLKYSPRHSQPCSSATRDQKLRVHQRTIKHQLPQVLGPRPSLHDRSASHRPLPPGSQHTADRNLQQRPTTSSRKTKNKKPSPSLALFLVYSPLSAWCFACLALPDADDLAAPRRDPSRATAPLTHMRAVFRDQARSRSHLCITTLAPPLTAAASHAARSCLVTGPDYYRPLPS